MNTSKSLEFHELANLFPLLDEAQLRELAADIKANGLREKITLLDGKILDGRNRYNAARAAGYDLTPESFELFEGTTDDAVTFVISKNILRRHLTDDQRAQISAELYEKLPKKKEGREQKQLSQICDSYEQPLPSADSQKQKVAKQMKVSVRNLERAAALRNKNPKLAAEVKAGTKKMIAAEKELTGKKSKPVKKAAEDSVTEGISSQMIYWAERDGRRLLIWEKIKDRAIPFWKELVELVDEDERPDLLDALEAHLDKYEREIHG